MLRKRAPGDQETIRRPPRQNPEISRAPSDHRKTMRPPGDPRRPAGDQPQETPRSATSQEWHQQITRVLPTCFPTSIGTFRATPRMASLKYRQDSGTFSRTQRNLVPPGAGGSRTSAKLLFRSCWRASALGPRHLCSTPTRGMQSERVFPLNNCCDVNPVRTTSDPCSNESWPRPGTPQANPPQRVGCKHYKLMTLGAIFPRAPHRDVDFSRWNPC